MKISFTLYIKPEHPHPVCRKRHFCRDSESLVPKRIRNDQSAEKEFIQG